MATTLLKVLNLSPKHPDPKHHNTHPITTMTSGTYRRNTQKKSPCPQQTEAF